MELFFSLPMCNEYLDTSEPGIFEQAKHAVTNLGVSVTVSSVQGPLGATINYQSTI